MRKINYDAPPGKCIFRFLAIFLLLLLFASCDSINQGGKNKPKVSGPTSFTLNGKTYHVSEDLGYMNWTSANTTCESYRGGGWRLPTKDEMTLIKIHLADKGKFIPQNEQQTDEKTGKNYQRYWTSTPGDRPDTYCNFDFQHRRWWTCPPTAGHRVIAIAVK